jgi:hypothetical protein
VYDEDVPRPPTTPVAEEKKPVQPEDATNNFNTAIKYGLNALAICSVPLEDDDLLLYGAMDDDDDFLNEEQLNQQKQQKEQLDRIDLQFHWKEQTVVLKERTLPYIIGTPEFFSDYMVGLVPDEEEVFVADGFGDDYVNALEVQQEVKQPDNYSVSSASGIPPPPPPGPPPQIHKNTQPQPQVTHVTTAYNTSDSNNLFTGRDAEEDNLFAPEQSTRDENVEQRSQPLDIKSQLAQVMTNKFKPPTETVEQNHQNKDDSDNIFASREDDKFSSGIFGSDSNSSAVRVSQDDTFDLSSLLDNEPKKKERPAPPPNKPQRKSNNFSFNFEEDSVSSGNGLFDDDFDIMSKKQVAPPTPDRSKKPKLKGTRGLFDDDEEDLSPVVQPKSNAVRNEPSNINVPPRKTSMFGFDEEDDFLSQPKKSVSNETKKTSEPEKRPIAQKKSLFDDDDLDFDFSSNQKSIEPKKEQPAVTKTVTKKSSLFDDVDDDFDFGSKKPSTPVVTQKNEPVKATTQTSNEQSIIQRKKSLFEESDDDRKPLVPKNKPVKKTVIQAPPDSDSPTSTTPNRRASVKGLALESSIMKGLSLNIGGGPPKAFSRIRGDSLNEPPTQPVESENESVAQTPDVDTMNTSSPLQIEKTVVTNETPIKQQPKQSPEKILDAPVRVNLFGSQSPAVSAKKEDTLHEEQKKKEGTTNYARDGASGGQTLTHVNLSRPRRSKRKPSSQLSLDSIKIPDSDSVSTIEPKPVVVTTPNKKAAVSKSSLFDDAEDDFVSKPSPTVSKSVAKAKNSLFDEEEEIVKSVTKANTPKSATSVKPKSSLFDDEDDFQILPNPKKNQVEQPKQSEKKKLIEPQQKQETSSDNKNKKQEEEKLTKVVTPPSSKSKTPLFDEEEFMAVKPVARTVAKTTPPTKQTTNSLFGDDIVPDKSVKVNTTKNVTPISAKNSNLLFNEEEDIVPDKPVTKTTTPKSATTLVKAKATLFEEEDDFLSNTKHTPEKKQVEQPSEKKAEETQKQTVVSDQKQEDPLQQKTATQSVEATSVKKVDNFLASNTVTSSHAIKKKEEQEKRRRSASTLKFNDDLDAPTFVKEPEPVKKVPSTKTPVSPFDEAFQQTAPPRKSTTGISIDDLFGDSTKKTSPLSNTTTTSASKQPAKKSATSATKGLFDDEEDIFSSVPKKATGKKPAAKKVNQVDVKDLFDF